MLVVIDTNVLYQALRSQLGASYYILSLIRNNKISLALSVQVFNEYEDVLTRPSSLKDFNLTREDIIKVLQFIAFIGKSYTTYYLFRPNLQDENDNIFIELSIASNSNYLITNNVRDFTTKSELKFQDLKVITPSDFVKIWRKKYESKG
ncbi:MAG: putative toxin-antitoxin system toxin component, PIN family [Spirochaetes bacterium]|nr:putative toxin-antitoxin system toxin component, PIN family [Spirochaetota bacterium]